MKIKNIFAATALALLAGGCANEPAPDSPAEGAPAGITLCVNAAEMTMTPDTRATAPMSPDEEKLIHSMAIFEFDNEGLHIKDNRTYHYVDFIKGKITGDVYDESQLQIGPTPYGVTETRLAGIRLYRYTNGTLCLVANVTEKQVDELYENYREEGQSYGRLTLDKFQDWTVPFEYYNPSEKVYEDKRTGLLTNMYMFGYFQGEIGRITNNDPKNPEYDVIDVDLGRLASRLDIALVNETGHDIEKRLAYHFDNVNINAYVFPGNQGFKEQNYTSRARTVICAGYKHENGEWVYEKDKNGNYITDKNGEKVRERDDVPRDVDTIIPTVFENGHTDKRYFYVAGHSASNKDEATQLHLYYDRAIFVGEGDVDPGESDPTNSVKIPLCNVVPSEADEVPDGKGYTLSRNTRYFFTIRIKPSSIPDNPPYTPGTEPPTDSNTPSGSDTPNSAPGSGSATPGSVPGSARITYETTGPNEITVYL